MKIDKASGRSMLYYSFFFRCKYFLMLFKVKTRRIDVVVVLSLLNNFCMDTDNHVAPPIPFVYWFELQNLRCHMCCREIKTKLIGVALMIYQCPLCSKNKKDNVWIWGKFESLSGINTINPIWPKYNCCINMAIYDAIF